MYRKDSEVVLHSKDIYSPVYYLVIKSYDIVDK